MSSPDLKKSSTISTQPKSSVTLDLESPTIIKSECKICLLKYPKDNLLETCSQSHKFCKNCLEFFLKNKVSDFQGLSISCPQDSCDQPLNEKILSTFLDEQLKKLYQQKRHEKIVGRNANMNFCPQPDCSRPYIPSKSRPYTRCKCHSKICNYCNHLWHENQTCLQALDVKFEDCTEFHGFKFCMMCKTVVQRIEGCLHITCPVCDYEWCWECGQEYNSLHQAVCPREWKPEPPRKVVNNEHEVPVREFRRLQMIVDIVLFIVTMPLKLVFAAFAICKLWEIIRDSEKICQKVFLFIVGLLLSAMYDVIIFSVLMEVFGFRTGKKNLPLISLLVLVLLPYLVYLLHEILSICSNSALDTKRSRNAANLKFVSPKIHNIYRENGDVLSHKKRKVPPVKIENILDGIFDEEKEISLEVSRKNHQPLGIVFDGILDQENFPNFENAPVGRIGIQDNKELSVIRTV